MHHHEGKLDKKLDGKLDGRLDGKLGAHRGGKGYGALFSDPSGRHMGLTASKTAQGMSLKDWLEAMLKGGGLQTKGLAGKAGLNGAAAMAGAKAGGLTGLAKALGLTSGLAAGAAAWKARQSGLFAALGDKLKALGKAIATIGGMGAAGAAGKTPGAAGKTTLGAAGKTAAGATAKSSGVTGKLIGASNKLLLEAAHETTNTAATGRKPVTASQSQSQGLADRLESAASASMKAVGAASGGAMVAAAAGLVNFGPVGWASIAAGVAAFGFWQLGAFLRRRQSKAGRAQGLAGGQRGRGAGSRSAGHGGGGGSDDDGEQAI